MILYITKVITWNHRIIEIKKIRIFEKSTLKDIAPKSRRIFFTVKNSILLKSFKI